jgi:hypothetical protein
MSAPRRYQQQPHGYAHYGHYPQPSPPAPQPVPDPARRPDHYAPGSNHPAHAAPPSQPLFRVRLIKHTGAVILLFNQRYTVTGTFAQCEAAIRDAQQHNLIAGWWSIASILAWNWIALISNHNARKVLRSQAAQAFNAHLASVLAQSAPPAWGPTQR